MRSLRGQVQVQPEDDQEVSGLPGANSGTAEPQLRQHSGQSHRSAWSGSHVMRFASLHDRFWSKVMFDGRHGLWTGAITKKGYGRFTISRGHHMLAHKWAWEEKNGPLPEGMELGHTCEFRHCVLCVRPVTHLQNIREGSRATKTCCVRGHSNWKRRKDNPNRRQCIDCQNEDNARRKGGDAQ